MSFAHVSITRNVFIIQKSQGWITRLPSPEEVRRSMKAKNVRSGAQFCQPLVLKDRQDRRLNLVKARSES